MKQTRELYDLVAAACASIGIPQGGVLLENGVIKVPQTGLLISPITSGRRSSWAVQEEYELGDVRTDRSRKVKETILVVDADDTAQAAKAAALAVAGRLVDGAIDRALS